MATAKRRPDMGVRMDTKRYHPPTEAEKAAYRTRLESYLEDNVGLVLTEAAQRNRAAVELGATDVRTTDSQATMMRPDGYVFAYSINVELTPALLIGSAIEAFTNESEM